MNKWEYMVEISPGDGKPETYTKWLNTFGSEGWELVVVHFERLYIFKRPVNGALEEGQ